MQVNFWQPSGARGFRVLTSRLRGGSSARILDGNRDGNDGSRQRPNAAVNSHVLSHFQPELGIRYT